MREELGCEEPERKAMGPHGEKGPGMIELSGTFSAEMLNARLSPWT